MTNKEGEAMDRYDKIQKLICPDCGYKLDDFRIKEGKHQGHGKVYCANCKQAKMII